MGIVFISLIFGAATASYCGWLLVTLRDDRMKIQSPLTLSFFLVVWYAFHFISFPIFAPMMFSHFNASLDQWVWFFTLAMILVYFLFQMMAIMLSRRFSMVSLIENIVLFKKTAIDFIHCRSHESFLKMAYLILTFALVGLIYSLYGTLNVYQIFKYGRLSPEAAKNFANSMMYIFNLVRSFQFLVFWILVGTFVVRKKYLFAISIALVQFLIALTFRSKLTIFSIPFTFLAFASWYWMRLKWRYLLACVPVVLIGIPFINISRRSGDFNLPTDIDGFLYLTKTVVWRGDFTHGFYQLIERIIQDGMDFLWGGATYQLVLRFIPRSIYPDRFGSSEVELTRRILGEFDKVSGWSFTYGGIGEFIFNFGLPGIIVAGIFSGVVLYSVNKILMNAILEKNVLFLGFVVSTPIWIQPWNIGINTTMSTSILPLYAVYFILVLMIRIWILYDRKRFQHSK